MALAFLLTFPSPNSPSSPPESLSCTRNGKDRGARSRTKVLVTGAASPFPSTRTPPSLLFTKLEETGISLDRWTRIDIDDSSRSSLCVCVYIDARIEETIITKERASTRWKDEAVVYRNIVSVPFRGASSIRIDIARRRIPLFPSPTSSFFLSSFLSPLFISSIRVVASIRSSSGV